MSDEALFEVLGEKQRDLQREAEKRWGDTDTWAQSRRRTARYTRQDWEDLTAESELIVAHIAEAYRSGAAPDSEAAMDAVEAHRRQITERFYDCSHEMHVHLGEMYVHDPRFTATYEEIEPGLTVWGTRGHQRERATRRRLASGAATCALAGLECGGTVRSGRRELRGAARPRRP